MTFLLSSPSLDSSQNRPRPRSTSAFPSSHPTGTDARHGTRVAAGTDCAISTVRSPVSHRGEPSTPRSWDGVKRLNACIDGEHRRAATSPTARATRRRLQRWSDTGGRAGAIWRSWASRSRPSCLQHRSQLGRAGHAPGGGERLAELVLGELLTGPPVDRGGVAADRQHQHHVPEVDGLAPRRGTHLGEGGVDHEHRAVPHHQVGRLDVSVGQAGVPEVRTRPSAWSMIDSSTSASPISTAPSMKLVSSMYSRSGVISTMP